METKDLEKDCESTINQVLTEQAPALEQITNEKALSNLSPKEQIALWRDKCEALKISDRTDTKGYTQVVKFIAFCRTTRTTLDKKRMEQKRFFLDAGKVIDGHYKELINLIEPIEEELNAKKKVVDDEKERIKKEKEQAEQAIFDGRVKQLMDAGCLFDGSSYYIKDSTFSVLSIAIKNADDAAFKEALKVALEAVEHVANEKKLKEEQERLAEEKEKLAQRTVGRIEMLKTFGFTDHPDHGEGVLYTRKYASKKFAEMGGASLSAHEVEKWETPVFNVLIEQVKDDIKSSKEDQEAAQQELEKKERELEQRELEEKKRVKENRKNKILALGYTEIEGEFLLTLPHVEDLTVKLNDDWSNDDFNSLLKAITTKVDWAKKESARLAQEEEKRKEQEAEKRAQELLEQKEKLRLEKEEEEKLKAEKKAARQPDKAKLVTLADRLEAMDIPVFKSEEAKKISEEAISRILSICAYLKDEAGKL